MQESKRRMSAFLEELVLMNGETELNQAEQEAIRDALEHNSAVGIVSGYYDEKLTISMASQIFWNNLGYEHSTEIEPREYTLLEFVEQEERNLFEPDRFRNLKGQLNFHILSKTGKSVCVYAYKTEAADYSGRRQWVLSVRMDHKENEALHQLANGMMRMATRFAVCNIEKNTYDFYSLGHGEEYAPTGLYSEFLQEMNKKLKLLPDVDTIDHVMSPENLRRVLKTETDVLKFEYSSIDGSCYYNMSVIPTEWENEKLTKILMIGQDNTHLKKIEFEAQKALEEAYAAANQANQAKTEFLTNMSHDIRTPLNAIIGMTAIAGAHIDQKERVLDCLGKITTSGRHLLALINEILDMSRIESGKMILTEEDFHLPELIDNMVDMVKGDIASHQHEFEVVLKNIEHEAVSGDSLRIQQIFINIVGNAIKYTPDGGKIRFSVSEKPTHHANIGCYEFVIEDNGIGMSEEFQEQIFEPFVRADSKRVTEIQGSGLGMPITRNIVHMMNGEIKVDSKLGEGTRITITIFLKLREMEDINVEELIDLPVLVVDDDLDCCESTVGILKSIGMVGEWVDNGADAVDLVGERHDREEDYFAVIVDWKMPDMDGIETAKRIRSRIGREVPIIMLSAYDYSEVEREARAAGVNGFITKPLFKSRLTTVFKQLVHGGQNKSAAGQLAVMAERDYSRKRVLIVEDNELSREIAVEIVGMTGAQVETAVNGKEAVDKVNDAERDYFDLIFMDIQMPIMNGYEAATAIRLLDEQKGQRVPIVAMTANAFAEDVIMAKNAGINEHIAKPINFEKLDEIMNTWL